MAPFEISAAIKLLLAVHMASEDKGAARVSTTMTVGSESMRRRLVLVTGMSGAGRSTALKELEDLGFEAIDNIPLAMLDNIDADRSGRPLRSESTPAPAISPSRACWNA